MGSRSNAKPGRLAHRLTFLNPFLLTKDTVSDIDAKPSLTRKSLGANETTYTETAAPVNSTRIEMFDALSSNSSDSESGERSDKAFDAFIEMQKNKLDAMKSVPPQQNMPDDDLASFFGSMEKATRKLPSRLQNRIKRGVSALVYDVEEEFEKHRHDKGMVVAFDRDMTMNNSIDCIL